MPKPICTQENVSWLPTGSTVEWYLSGELPPLSECSSVYAFVFKDGSMLQTELREGERETRQLDIPGGHIETGETPEQAVERETFEETGVKVKVQKLVAHGKVTIHIPKPENYKYPYPTSYMLFYICDVLEELPFDGNEDTHGRVWLAPSEFEKSKWCIENKILLDAIMI